MRLTTGLGLGEAESAVKPTSFWRISSRVEDHLLTKRNETIYLRILFWAMFVVSAAYVLTFLRRSDLSEDVVWILHLKGYLLITLFTIGLLYIYKRMLNHLFLGPGLKKLKLKLPDESAVPVRITIRQNGCVTGIDEGYMWLADGTIFYKGRQTTFRLNREDVPAITLWKRKDRPNLSMNKMPHIIPVPYNNINLAVSYEILDSHEDFATRRQAAEFQNKFVNWLNERPQGSLESLLPPTQLHPGFKFGDRQGYEPLIAALAMSITHLTIVLSMNYGVSFRGSAVGFAGVCTLIHIILLFVCVRFLIEAKNCISLRINLEKKSDSI